MIQHDPLKDLLNAAPTAQVVERDLAFTIATMTRVERKRLVESVAWIIGLAVVGCGLLALIMPFLTPALADIGPALAPACAVLVALGLCWYAYDFMQRFVRI